MLVFAIKKECLFDILLFNFANLANKNIQALATAYKKMKHVTDIPQVAVCLQKSCGFWVIKAASEIINIIFRIVEISGITEGVLDFARFFGDVAKGIIAIGGGGYTALGFEPCDIAVSVVQIDIIRIICGTGHKIHPLKETCFFRAVQTSIDG